nr:nucleic acid-binding, OB-fold protein [Tanacetum cinerariifolium]
TENDSLDPSSATRVDNLSAESEHYDYIGCIQGINRVLTSGDATTNRIHQRIIDIQNLSGIIGLTLWNEMETKFDIAGYELMPKPIVIA